MLVTGGRVQGHMLVRGGLAQGHLLLHHLSLHS